MAKESAIISACLLGVCCRYDGKSNEIEGLDALREKYNLIPVCPEQIGGLSTPRKPAEIQSGEDHIKVLNCDGEDVTREFRQGAEMTLKIAKLLGTKKALLKGRSPSCGCGEIYDGTFSKELVQGDGLTAKLLKENGIEVEIF